MQNNSRSSSLSGKITVSKTGDTGSNPVWITNVIVNMEETSVNIAKLYYRYKRTSDKEIQDRLKKVRLVVLKHDGPGTTFGYYPLTKNAQAKIAEKPRSIAFRYGNHETEKKPLESLVEYKRIPFLVKSSSRFFLKDDIGEVFDQMDIHDLYTDFKAIAVTEEYQELAGTEGEHFIKTAILFK